MNTAYRHSVLVTIIFLLAGIAGTGGQDAFANEPPVAEAGPSRYAAQESLRLDGTRSYDPDNSGPLTYSWTQVSGPPVVITGETTIVPTLSGFVQTQEVQECQFQLLVSDGQQTSSPDTVKVVIVPDFGPSTLQLENGPFDPSKATVIFFGGSNGIVGIAGPLWDPGPAWTDRANIVEFPSGYTPDSGTARRAYYKYGDMIIAYLSAVAPDYRQAIQTIGASGGVDPAIDVGIRLNETYRDARYAVNRVTQIDGFPRLLEGGSTLLLPVAVARLLMGSLTLKDMDLAKGWSWWLEPQRRFLASSVDGEPCWIDFYWGSLWSRFVESSPRSSILWVRTTLDHASIGSWYFNSLTGADTNKFNRGVIAGAYWSVIGPGRNLQLASTPGTYYFAWNGSAQNGTMGFRNLAEYPGRLPEPVTLVDFHDPSFPEDDPNGLILTCRESQNAVGYQLLCGSNPYDVAHYTIVADGNTPPAVPAAKLPSSDTWWTVKVRDAYGSTIYADPIRLGVPAGVIAWWKLDEVEGNRAVDAASDHEGIVHGEALWQPAGGKKGGALAFDGVDDYVSTPLVVNPANGAFTLFIWVKGGAPGQVILSQENGANWLMAGSSDGALMTDLKAGGRRPQALTSRIIITDGDWHQVGLSWDGANRTLYVDDVEVAKDTQPGLPGSTDGMYIGTGSKLAAGTFWSGLIDDVRIYNRVVSP